MQWQNIARTSYVSSACWVQRSGSRIPHICAVSREYGDNERDERARRKSWSKRRRTYSYAVLYLGRIFLYYYFI